MTRPKGVIVDGVYYAIAGTDNLVTLKNRYDAAVARGDKYSQPVIKAKLDALKESQSPAPIK